MASKAYQAIDVHAKSTDAWPEVVPPLTAEEATKALRRLYRFSMRKTFNSPVTITSGNRRACSAKYWNLNSREWRLNPSKGWREFIHDLSHWLDLLANGESKHGKHHARFEAKLIAEVVRRGYMDGKLSAPEPKAKPPIEERVKRLASIEARLVTWAKKQLRAQRAIAKLEKQQRAYRKALD